MDTDRIEKRVLLRATQSRVWQALTDFKQFGSWFGLKLDRPFAAGEKVRGVIARSTVDPASSRVSSQYEGRPFEFVIDRIEPERLFSFRWHPAAIEAGVDYSAEPMTLVTFTLELQPGGVLLVVTESGFDEIPTARREAAFKMNEGGWTIQIERIEKYLAHVS